MASTTALDRAETLKKEGNAHYALAQYKAAVGIYCSDSSCPRKCSALFESLCGGLVLKECKGHRKMPLGQ